MRTINYGMQEYYSLFKTEKSVVCLLCVVMSIQSHTIAALHTLLVSDTGLSLPPMTRSSPVGRRTVVQ